MNDRTLLHMGLIGTVVTRPMLLHADTCDPLGVVGLSAVLGWLDYLSMPALAVFVAITVYALWRKQRTT